MKINCIINDKEITIENNGVTIIMGPNGGGKSTLLNRINTGFLGKNPGFLVNGLKPEVDNYNVIYYDDIADFNTKFKFTKSNIFKKMIYKEILKDDEIGNLTNKANKIFDIIDKKVNKLLDDNVNKDNKNKLMFDIDITNIENIIDKFTDIYINSYLLNSDIVPKSTRRKLIYNFLEYMITETEQKSIVIIDNFDIFLDRNELIDILMLFEKLNKKHDTRFFLTTISNIYNLIYQNNVYRLSETDFKPVKFNNNFLSELIKKNNSMLEKEPLLIEEDFEIFKERYILPNLSKIGEILLSKEISLKAFSKDKENNFPIIYKDKVEKEIYKYLSYINNVDIN